MAQTLGYILLILAVRGVMLLSKIIQSLSPAELTELRSKLAVPQRSRELLEKLANSRGPIDTIELCGEFTLSKTNLYRLCSELADECVRILAPQDEFAKLQFYRKKFLASEFVIEVGRIERKLVEENDREKLERLYKFAFESIIGFPIIDININTLESYGMKWWRSKKDATDDDRLYVRIRTIYATICALPGIKKMTVEKMSAKARELLDPVIASAINSSSPLVRYFYFQSEWKACNYSNIIGEERTNWPAKSLEIIRANPDKFPEGSLQAAELLHAYERGYYCGETRKAFELYQQFYNGQTPESSRGGLFFIRFTRMAICVKEYATARELLDKVDSFQFIKKTPGIQMPMLLMRTVLDLLEGEYQDVGKHISILRALNCDENFFLPYEVELRALETAYALKRGDLELAELLAIRNIKWMHTRRYSLSQSPWPYFYQTIRSWITFKLTSETPRPSIFSHFDQFKKISPQYALLLEEEVAIMFADVETK